MDFKDQLRIAYNSDAERRVDNEENRESWKLDIRNSFTELLKTEEKTTVLELGAGVGTDSQFFQENGFDVLAVDLSEKMVEKCKEKGINSTVLDIYDLPSLGTKFDAIYSLNVLLHIPKADLANILSIISDSLESKGLFFYGVYGGEDIEKIIDDKSKMGLPRFFSFFSDEALLNLINDRFEVVSFKAIGIGSKDPNFHFQALTLRKR